MPQRQETENKIINIREELKEGLERLVTVRKKLGDAMARTKKFIDV